MSNQMTIENAISTGFSTLIIGMLIIFAVLFILMLAIQVMKILLYKEPQKTKVSEPIVEPAPIAEPSVEADDDELIAVLTAAIAASLNTSTYNLKIKSYRRIESRNSAWNKAAIHENNMVF